MKKATSLVAILAASVVPCLSHAQSSVTLYGIVNASVQYVSNLKSGNGTKSISLMDGAPQASRWGLRGVVDLGDGRSAYFTLENGFSAVDGTLGQGGRIFGRQAFVGIRDSRIGMLTAGRQYDSVRDYVAFASMKGETHNGRHFAHMFDSDNEANSFRISNSVKYTSLNFAGFSFNSLYGFSNQPGAFKTSRAYTFGAGYAQGPIRLGIAFEQFDNRGVNSGGALSSGADAAFAASSQRIYSLGGTYNFSHVKFALNFARTTFDHIKSGPIVANYLRLDDYETWVRYDVTSAFFVAGGYTFTDGKQTVRAVNSDPKWHQFNLTADYLLSKRTDLFMISVFQKAASDATFAYISGTGATSITFPGSAKQALVKIGIRTKF
jgi:GBP family porin